MYTKHSTTPIVHSVGETVRLDGREFLVTEVDPNGAFRLEEVRPEPDEVDAAQMKALDETIREWEKKAAGEAEYTGTWSDCPMCVANTPLREKPGWSNTTCETCLLFRYLEPVGETCIRHPKLARAERNSTCLLYTSPSPRDRTRSRMPSSA